MTCDELDIDDCAVSPCITGICIDKINSATCSCPSSIFGGRCEVGEFTTYNYNSEE